MKNSILIILAVLLSFCVEAQDKLFDGSKKPLLKVRKTGPYLGIQQGKYRVLEVGGEMQFKQFKLVKPKVHAFNMGFDYNFFENVLGYSAGYWFKTGRLDLTYGANLVYRTNFDQTRVGFGPAVGFKFSALHLQTGYNFLTPSDVFTNTSDIYISLRFVLISDRNFKWRKRKKK
mgnify:CR=1 FL=1